MIPKIKMPQLSLFYPCLFLCALPFCGTCPSAQASPKDLICQLIETHGYACQVHRVHTTDGYELSVHRIPPLPSPPSSSSSFASIKRNSSDSSNNNNTQQQPRPFLLMHGLLGSAADFILPGRNRGLAAMLHDAGHDVWLANARGTTYSKSHKWLDTKLPNYWDFSWHEIGIYDLPAIVDYISASTGQRQLHYAAHSQGTTAFFVMLTERPEYNERFVSASLLAPVAYLTHLRSPPLRLLAAQSQQIEALLNHLGLHELFPSTALNQLGGHLLCGDGLPTQNLCMLATFWSVGFSDYPMDRQLFPRIFETTPAGISRKQIQHFAQLINSGKFQKFDFGSRVENFRHYQRKTPPPYNMSRIHVPLQLFFGTNDLLLTQKDVFRLARDLQNSRHVLKEVSGFNHIDLLYANAAPKRIYQHILNEAKYYDTS